MKTTLIYIGLRNNGEDLCSVFIKSGESDRIENYLFFKKAKRPIGSSFEAEQNGERMLLNVSSMKVDVIKNQNLINKWIAESKAAEARHKDVNARYRAERTLLSEDLKNELKKHIKDMTGKDVHYFIEHVIMKFMKNKNVNEFKNN